MNNRPTFSAGPMAFFDSTGAIAKPEDFQRPDWMNFQYSGLTNHQRDKGMTVGPTGLSQNMFMNWDGTYVTPPEQEAQQPAATQMAQPAGTMQQQMQQPMAQPAMQQPMTQTGMQPNMGQGAGQNALMPGQPTIGGQPMNMMNQYQSRFRPMSPMQGYQNALMGA
jgi:hypothetical protein